MAAEIHKKLVELEGLAHTAFNEAVSMLQQLSLSDDKKVASEARSILAASTLADSGRKDETPNKGGKRVMDLYLANLLDVADKEFLYSFPEEEALQRIQGAIDTLEMKRGSIQNQPYNGMPDGLHLDLRAALGRSYMGVSKWQGQDKPEFYAAMSRIAVADQMFKKIVKCMQR